MNKSKKKYVAGFEVKSIIVFIWSQLDGGKVEQRTMAKVHSKTLSGLNCSERKGKF